MLTDDDKQWMLAQLERNKEWTRAQFDGEREWTLAQLERLETKLLTEFHKWASPVEMRSEAIRPQCGQWTLKLRPSPTA
jgi:hypothetical protein